MSYGIYDYVNPAAIKEALNLTDPRIDLEIDWDGRNFCDTWCDIFRGQPAAVLVDYVGNMSDDDEEDWQEVEGTYSWAAAKDALASIVDSERVSVTNDVISVRVNAHAVVYTMAAAMVQEQAAA